MVGGEVATFLLLYSLIAYTVWRKGGVKFPLLHLDYSIFWVSHARLSSWSLFYIIFVLSLFWQYILVCIVSIVYFWFILIVYRKCWLLYSFKLVWNTQKITWTSTKAWCFLILKMFWCLNALPYCFFLHIFEVKLSNFYWPITWEM